MKLHCKHSLSLVLLSLLLLAACGDSGEPEPPLAQGERPYLQHCAACHGPAGQGRAPAFPPLAGSEWLELPSNALVAIVLLGLRGEIEVAGRRYSGFMPSLQHIGDAELAEIVNFSRSRWASGDATLTAEEVAALRTRLAGRGMLEGRADLERLLETLP